MLNVIALLMEETAEQAYWKFTGNISMNWEYRVAGFIGSQKRQNTYGDYK